MPTSYQAVRARKDASPFRMAPVRPAIPPPEALDWWWHPNRVGVRGAPDWFRAQLTAFDPDIQVTWNAYREYWLVWMRSPKFQTPICQGWKLLFRVTTDEGVYRPLDERIFARLFSASDARWGSGRKYFDHIEAEQARDQAKAAANRKGDVGHSAGEYFDYCKIKVSGCGPSSGSKFSTHHA